MTASDEPTEAVPRDRPPLAPAGAARRLSLRIKGLLAISSVMVVALLLVAPALLFRGVVQGHLEELEQAQDRHELLLQRRVQQPSEEQMADILQQLRRSEAEQKRQLKEASHFIDGGTVVIACIAWLGITCIGALGLLFFSRLASDIGVVRARALAIVTGDRSPGQPLLRNDELSDLGQAVDDLAGALARRERDLAIERRQVSHHEKMAAIGSMAAGVLREIGNPIAAIDGYARAMREAQRGAGPGRACAAGNEAEQILHETARLVAITHDISALAASPASERQLASLNEIASQALALLRYEPRLAGVTVVSHLDPQLPAVMASAERLVLLLTNVLINAADSTAALPPRTGRIEVATRRCGEGVELSVTDNGCGMGEAVRERAFEPLFTTKPAGLGTGLGLPLCRSIALDHDGRISLETELGKGTHVCVWLPLPATGEPLH